MEEVSEFILVGVMFRSQEGVVYAEGSNEGVNEGSILYMGFGLNGGQEKVDSMDESEEESDDL